MTTETVVGVNFELVVFTVGLISIFCIAMSAPFFLPRIGMRKILNFFKLIYYSIPRIEFKQENK